MAGIFDHKSMEYNIPLIADIFIQILDGVELFIPIYRDSIKLHYHDIDSTGDLPVVCFLTSPIEENYISTLNIHFIPGYINKKIIKLLRDSDDIIDNNIQFSINQFLQNDNRFLIEIEVSER